MVSSTDIYIQNSTDVPDKWNRNLQERKISSYNDTFESCMALSFIPTSFVSIHFRTYLLPSGLLTRVGGVLERSAGTARS